MDLALSYTTLLALHSFNKVVSNCSIQRLKVYELNEGDVLTEPPMIQDTAVVTPDVNDRKYLIGTIHRDNEY